LQLPDGSTRPLTVINVYCPRHREDHEEPSSNNTDFKLAFHRILHRRAKQLVQDGSFVLVVGDMNIIHRLLDQADVTDAKVINNFWGLDFELNF